MSHIFISYASEDIATAQSLAQALKQRGWSVWWDRNIPPGKYFDQVIDEAIEAASCIIVLWSAASVISDWVKAHVGGRLGPFLRILSQQPQYERVQPSRAVAVAPEGRRQSLLPPALGHETWYSALLRS